MDASLAELFAVEPLGFSTASQLERTGKPLIASVILSVARLKAAKNPKRLVSLSIVVLRSQLDAECLGSLWADFAVWQQLVRKLKCHHSCVCVGPEFAVQRAGVEARRF